MKLMALLQGGRERQRAPLCPSVGMWDGTWVVPSTTVGPRSVPHTKCWHSFRDLGMSARFLFLSLPGVCWYKSPASRFPCLRRTILLSYGDDNGHRRGSVVAGLPGRVLQQAPRLAPPLRRCSAAPQAAVSCCEAAAARLRQGHEPSGRHVSVFLQSHHSWHRDFHYQGAWRDSSCCCDVYATLFVVWLSNSCVGLELGIWNSKKGEGLVCFLCVLTLSGYELRSRELNGNRIHMANTQRLHGLYSPIHLIQILYSFYSKFQGNRRVSARHVRSYPIGSWRIAVGVITVVVLNAKAWISID